MIQVFGYSWITARCDHDPINRYLMNRTLISALLALAIFKKVPEEKLYIS